jgi:hypothetical protein
MKAQAMRTKTWNAVTLIQLGRRPYRRTCSNTSVEKQLHDVPLHSLPNVRAKLQNPAWKQVDSIGKEPPYFTAMTLALKLAKKPNVVGKNGNRQSCRGRLFP